MVKKTQQSRSKTANDDAESQALPTLRQNLRKLRKAADLTQDRLMSMTGLTSIKMIETGRTGVSVEGLLKIAQALDVPLDALVADPERPLPEVLVEFLKTPGASDVTTDEIEHLRTIRARGRRPSVDTYYWALKSLRSMR